VPTPVGQPNFFHERNFPEDLPTSHAQQRALSTGMLTSIHLGRNEGGLQQFHRWTDTILNTPDAELNELFRNGIDH